MMEEEKSEDKPEDEDDKGDLEKICLHMEQEEFSDAMITLFENVMLAPTLAYGSVDTQKAIIFHELGHNLEKYFRDGGLGPESIQGFNRVYACLNSIHPEGTFKDITRSISGTITVTTKEPVYFTEDFADFIASKLNPAINKDCDYLSFSYESGHYQTINADNVDLVNHNAEDAHSSESFRVLRGALDSKGLLPLSCNEVLHSMKYNQVPSCSFAAAEK